MRVGQNGANLVFAEAHTEGKWWSLEAEEEVNAEETSVGGVTGRVWAENREGLHWRAWIKSSRVRREKWIQGTHRQSSLRGLNREKSTFQGSVTE